MQTGQKIAEGKTKIIWKDPADTERVLIESKDDITAGDGAQRDTLAGKAVAATTTTCNAFNLLNHKGVRTHYQTQISERMFAAWRAEMIPLECVVRRVATESYLKRNPDATEGEVFDDLVFELFHKDDANHDPILELKEFEALRYRADRPAIVTAEALDSISYEQLKLGDSPSQAQGILFHIEEETKKTFEVLEAAWAEQDVQLVDLKIEFGWIAPRGRVRELVVADVIDNDSWRIWPGGDKTQMKDKQVYRELAGVEDPEAKAKELGKIKQNYEEVALRTNLFVASL